jgi:CDGSH-type Zn-finger protein
VADSPDSESVSGPITEVEIKVRHNGPYKVTGTVRLIDHEGNELPAAEGPIALCRCGHSADKPLCDGTHRDAGFDGTLRS